MTDVILKATEEQITCSICFDLFEEPKALPCLHTFCKACIKNHIEKYSQSAPIGFTCPICRRFVAAPPGVERKPSEWVTYLEANHVVVTLLEAYKTPRSFKTCDKHENKNLDFYCFDHNIYICCVCALKHRKCENVQTREDAEKTLSKTDNDGFNDEKESLIKMALEQCNEFENILAERKSRILTIEEEENKVLLEIKGIRSRITKILDKEEENFKNKLTKRKLKEIEKIESEIRKCEKIADRAKSSLDILQRMQEGNPNSDLQKICKNIESGKKKLQSARNKSLCHALKFQPHSAFDEFIQNLDKFGHIQVMHSSGFGIENSEESISKDTSQQKSSCTESSTRKPKPTPRRRPLSMNPDVDMIRIRERHTLDVNIAHQKPCWITGVVVLSSGDIVLVDYHNERVLLYNSYYHLIHHIRVTPSPYDVTVIDRNTILLTRPDAKDGLLSCTINNGLLIVDKGWNLGIRGRCLNYCNNKLVVCSHELVEIYKKEDVYWMLMTSKLFEGAKFTYAVIENEAEKIFITNQKYPNPEVLCISVSGAILWRFVDSNLSFPTGVALKNGRLLTASWDSCKILELSTDGNYIGIVADTHLQFPWKLCLNNDILIVSQHKGALEVETKKSVKILQIE